ncbi:BPI fold-containing family B member 2-like [Microcaecilia unicolor]|uniref:BPI fold-containing family B member 2-like n=1 Tax=Microcaecilia unicolor TaxID=1415580 RepID=A0A6P7XLG0_9AMPH|nr:BPI fold-containing family B member 2-like [Microcaecilia unicolor]
MGSALLAYCNSSEHRSVCGTPTGQCSELPWLLQEPQFRSGEMVKLYVLAIILGSFFPSHGTDVGPDILMRVNEKAAELICLSQRSVFQNILAAIQIPNFTSGSVLGISLLNIVGIQIKKVDISQLSVDFVPETKSEFTLEADLSIEAKVLLTTLKLKMAVQIGAEVAISKGAKGSPVGTVTACTSVLGQLQLVSPGVLSISLDLLQNHLHRIFNEQLCLKITLVFDLLDVKLEAFSALTAFGPVSQIQYTLTRVPETTTEVVDFGLNVIFYISGEKLDLDLAPISISLPAPSSSSSPLLSLALSENVFVLLYTAIQESGLLNFEITGQTIGVEIELTTAALSVAIPEINELYPDSLAVILKIVVSRSPVFTLEADKLTLHLIPSVDIIVKPPNEDAKSLMVLDFDVLLRVTLQVVHGKLWSSAVLIGDLSFSLQTSAMGSIDVSELQSLIGNTLMDAYLLHLNEALSVELTLPTLLNMDLNEPTIAINPGFVLLSFVLQLPL